MPQNLHFNSHGLLDPGDYEMTFADLERSVLVTGSGGSTWDKEWRLTLVNNARMLVEQLWAVGIRDVFLDGSFVEQKDHPNDIDGYFHCDVKRYASGQLEQELNKLDPHKVWTWHHSSRRAYRGYPKKQLPMWHRYRVELYPHYPGLIAMHDVHGNELQFPAAFRQSRADDSPKGIIKIVEARSSLPGKEQLMIRTEREYQGAVVRLEQDCDVIAQQKGKLQELGLSDDEVSKALEPSLCFHEQLKEEVSAYERLKRGEIGPFYNLANIGRILIGLRIALSLTQKELADKLGVAESSVSRDERNEYHGISVERAQRIFDVLHVKPKIEVVFETAA